MIPIPVPSASWHEAEAFKQGPPGDLRFGWQCLRCDIETLVEGGDAVTVERLAFQHNAEHAGLLEGLRAEGPAEPESTLRDVWGKVHVARFAWQHGGTAVPDSFYAGVIHAERIIEEALGFRPGSMASDPREQFRRLAAFRDAVPPG